MGGGGGSFQADIIIRILFQCLPLLYWTCPSYQFEYSNIFRTHSKIHLNSIAYSVTTVWDLPSPLSRVMMMVSEINTVNVYNINKNQRRHQSWRWHRSRAAHSPWPTDRGHCCVPVGNCSLGERSVVAAGAVGEQRTGTVVAAAGELRVVGAPESRSHATVGVARTFVAVAERRARNLIAVVAVGSRSRGEVGAVEPSR